MQFIHAVLGRDIFRDDGNRRWFPYTLSGIPGISLFAPVRPLRYYHHDKVLVISNLMHIKFIAAWRRVIIL